MLRKAFKITDPPPSTNRAWRNFRGHMVKSEHLRSWTKAAQLEISIQARGFRLPDPCYFSSRIFVPRSKTSIDIDNASKAVHDAFKSIGVTPDDRYLVKTLQQYWAGDYLLVEIQQESLETWQKNMNPSRSLIRKLAKSGS